MGKAYEWAAVIITSIDAQVVCRYRPTSRYVGQADRAVFVAIAKFPTRVISLSETLTPVCHSRNRRLLGVFQFSAASRPTGWA